MRLIRGLQNLARQARPSAVTIGNFDGVHRGHQALLARQAALCGAGEQRVVLVFEPTPREHFAPESAPPRIQTFRDKLACLQVAGVYAVLCLRFGAALAAMSAERFVREVLVDGLRASSVVVGDDFRFGAGRQGDLELLQAQGAEQGFVADGLASVREDGRRISSTAIREALAIPDLVAAEAMLGRPLRIGGRVRKGLQLGRELGMPTANLMLRRRPALRYGVYAVRVAVDGGRRRDGVANLGVRPTLDLQRMLLEAHVFDCNEDFYGRQMSVEFVHFLRPEKRFDDIGALSTQMQADAARARELLSA